MITHEMTNVCWSTNQDSNSQNSGLSFPVADPMSSEHLDTYSSTITEHDTSLSEVITVSGFKLFPLVLTEKKDTSVSTVFPLYPAKQTLRSIGSG